MYTPRTRTLVTAAGVLTLLLFAGFGVCLAIETDSPEGAIGTTAPLSAMAIPVLMRKDRSLIVTKTLANGAAAASSSGIDTQCSNNGHNLADVEYEILAPAMNVTEMPNAKTMIYKVEHDDASGFGTVATLLPSVITQTGAGGAGCAAATFRFRLPSTAKRYIRVTATGSASGDATTATMTFQARF